MTQLLEIGNFRHFDFDGGKALVKKTQWEAILHGAEELRTV